MTLIGLVSAALLLLAGCGGSTEEGATEQPAATTAAPAATTAPATTAPATTAPATTVEVAVPASGEPIVLGLPVNQSGPVGVADHQDWVNGVTLAIEEINAVGGVLGRPLETFIVDTDILTPDGTAAGFLAMADAEVDAILSPFVLIPQPAMDAAAAYGAPYLHGNTQQSMLDLYASDPVAYRNMFQIDTSEVWYGAGLPAFLDDLAASGEWVPKNNRMHIVQGQIAYTQVISEATQAALEASGGTWELGGITDIQFPVQDWAPVIAELHDSDAGVIMIDYWVAAELAAFAQAFSADPVEGALVYLQYGPSQPEFLDLGGEATEGFVWGTVLGTYADEQGQAFRDAYQARFPGTMGLAYTGGGYDTVQLLADAIEAAGTTEFGPVIDAIEKTAYRGVTGFYSFDENHSGQTYPDQVSDPEAGQAHLFLQVQDGAHRIIYPEPYDEVDYITPPWAQGVEVAVPASGEPIVLGLPVNQSGPVGVADHQDWVNGVTLAIEEINAVGGVLGRPLETFIVDTDILTPDGTAAGFLAMADAEVDAILSPFVLIPQPAMDAAAAYGAPYLHGNTQQSMLDLYASDPVAYRNMFQIDTSEVWYGAGLPAFLDDLAASGEWVPKNNRMHIVQGQIAYTQVISEATQAALEASGGTWELGGITDIQFPVQDWAPVIAELHDSDAGVIMIDYWVAAELAAFAQAFSADPVEGALVYLQYGPSQPEFLDLGGEATEGFVWGTVLGTYADEQGQAFRDAYQARFPGTMGLAYTGGGYDTVQLLADAIEAAGTTEFGPVIDAIEKTAYRGVTGFYSFDENHSGQTYPDQVSDPEAGQAHLFLQVQDGAHRIIYPEPYDEVDYITPPWAQG
ncbi:MAG: ABC transporter substrate-binding protein [Actinobacteria bacterium]|nr:ABC transporter substrate-binding protein [Actinomycetota bacterium]